MENLFLMYVYFFFCFANIIRNLRSGRVLFIVRWFSWALWHGAKPVATISRVPEKKQEKKHTLRISFRCNIFITLVYYIFSIFLHQENKRWIIQTYKNSKIIIQSISNKKQQFFKTKRKKNGQKRNFFVTFFLIHLCYFQWLNVVGE